MRNTKVIMLLALLLSEVAQADIGSLYRISPDLGNRNQTPNTIGLKYSDEAFTLSQSSTVQPYFVSAGDGFENQFGWHDDNTETPDHDSEHMIWKNTSTLDDGDKPATRKPYNGANVVIGDDLCYLRDDIAYLSLEDYNVYAAAALNPIDVMRVIAATLPELGLMALSLSNLSSDESSTSDNDNVDLNDTGFAIDIGVSNSTTMAAAAPEPEVWLMIMLGLAGIGFRRIRQLRGLD